jgi:alginate O-acetyltransferase complex protein AlgJ
MNKTRFLLCAILSLFLSALPQCWAGPESPSAWEQGFVLKLSTTLQDLGKSGTDVLVEPNGWLFLPAELRFLSVGPFWGADAVKVARASKPDLADPLPAIVDFDAQLKKRGIHLILVPVPPKAAIYPEKIFPDPPQGGADAAPFEHQFYRELAAKGVEVLDLTELFLKNRENERGPVYCQTDTHWSGVGCALAGPAIAEAVRKVLPAGAGVKEYVSEWTEVTADGDLNSLLPKGTPRSPEKLKILSVKEKASGAAIVPDPNSPVLLLGDSHTLVLHDFLAEKAGLIDQLALNLGSAPDRIGTRGSGASPVRVDLYRRSSKDPGYLAKKKVVVWCFTAREFTEADGGWRILPVAK